VVDLDLRKWLGQLPDPERFRALALQTPVVAWWLDASGVMTSVIGGRPDATAASMGRHYEVAFADYPKVVEYHRRALAGEEVQGTVEFRGKILDAWYSPLRGPNNEIAGVFGLAVDVTERERTMQDLRKAEELTQRVLQAVPSGVVMVAPDGAILRANETAVRFLGLSYEQLTHRYISDFGSETIAEDGTPVPVEDYPVARCLLTRKPQPPATIGVRRLSTGEIFWGVFTAIPLEDPLTKDFLGALVTFIDISERKKYEDERARLRSELWQAQKLEALGRLAGGVAHDFNNLLGVMFGHADLIKRVAPPGSEQYVAAETIEMAAERGATLTKQLLGFAQTGKYQEVPFDLNRVVKETISLVERTVRKGIELVHRPSDRPALVCGDPGQLQQVILNLLLNARDAIGSGGSIVFSVDEVEVEEGEAPTEEARPGRFVRLSVSDTGSGIPPKDLPHIFEPFFTTKPAGQGTGMGLAMVYGTVKNHGGWILVESKEGKGTNFSVHLPRGEERPLVDAGLPRLEPKAEKARVLVVDDEALMRTTAKNQLAAMGFEVEAAASGPEAIDLYRGAKSTFDVVLLDLVMPGMDGCTCFNELKRLDPRVSVVLTTGYGNKDVVQRLISDGARSVLEKPYRSSALAEAIKSALSRGPG
jgi:PAS domain S-box-containing protein